MLAALYQDDIVDEDDIRAWHATKVARGNDMKPGSHLEGVKYCWVVGQKMIQQFDAQESSEEESGEDDDSDEE